MYVRGAVPRRLVSSKGRFFQRTPLTHTSLSIMRVDVDVDGSTIPLLRGDRKNAEPSSWWKKNISASVNGGVAAGVLVLVLCAAAVAVPQTRGFLRSAVEHAGWVPCDGCPLLAPGASTAPQPQVKFILHSACKSKRAKLEYHDFWISDRKRAYVVRHNYQSTSMFETPEAIPMTRVKLGEQEYGYEVGHARRRRTRWKTADDRSNTST